MLCRGGPPLPSRGRSGIIACGRWTKYTLLNVTRSRQTTTSGVGIIGIIGIVRNKATVPPPASSGASTRPHGLDTPEATPRTGTYGIHYCGLHMHGSLNPGVGLTGLVPPTIRCASSELPLTAADVRGFSEHGPRMSTGDISSRERGSIFRANASSVCTVSGSSVKQSSSTATDAVA